MTNTSTLRYQTCKKILLYLTKNRVWYCIKGYNIIHSCLSVKDIKINKNYGRISKWFLKHLVYILVLLVMLHTIFIRCTLLLLRRLTPVMTGVYIGLMGELWQRWPNHGKLITKASLDMYGLVHSCPTSLHCCTFPPHYTEYRIDREKLLYKTWLQYFLFKAPCQLTAHLHSIKS